jgi:photosystem II stability/assembly factor-like uncharacterized protein
LTRRLRQLYLLWIVLTFEFLCPTAHAVSWFAFGPDGGSARAFAADPRDPAHLYLGAANGWIYQSRDGGRKWERLAQVGKRDDLVIDNILVDPANPRHLVVGAWVLSDLNHPDGGLFVSNDGGATWAGNPEMRGQSIRALASAPSEPKIFVAGSIEGVFRSNDSGVHWERISPKDNAELHEVESVAIDPADPNIIYAGTWHLPWKTVDGGGNWRSIKQGIIDDSDVFSIIVDPKQPSVVYASACSGIYKSGDGGTKFDKVQGIPSTARRTLVLMQDPNNLNIVFAGTTEGLYRTFDAGKIWIQTTAPDVIVNDVYVDPSNSKHVLLATDRRGVLSSDDGGDSFTPTNAGFSARQITAFSVDSEHPATVYVGVVNDKDAGGVFVSHTGGLSWSHLSEGLDGRDVFSLAQTPDGTMLAGTSHGIYRLKDAVWQRVGDDSKAAVNTAPPPPTEPKTKAAHKPVGRSTAAKRRPVAKPRVAIAPAKVKNFDGSVYGFARAGDTMIAVTSQGVLQSASSGAKWSLAAGLPVEEWRFVAASKDTVVVASLNAMMMSTDGGSTWQAVALPPHVAQVSALSVDGQGELWIGDRNGVYVSADRGSNWKPVTNLYVRDVNSLFYDERGERVLVTTNGPATSAFSVAARSKQVTSWDTGWNLRFMRPVGDHLVGATLFDGIVVQPRMVDSAETAAQ